MLLWWGCVIILFHVLANLDVVDELREGARVCLKGHYPTAVVRIQIQHLVEKFSLVLADYHDAAVHFYEILTEVGKRPTQVLFPEDPTAVTTVRYGDVSERTSTMFARL